MDRASVNVGTACTPAARFADHFATMNANRRRRLTARLAKLSLRLWHPLANPATFFPGSVVPLVRSAKPMQVRRLVNAMPFAVSSQWAVTSCHPTTNVTL
jgi:hypothetical protein